MIRDATSTSTTPTAETKDTSAELPTTTSMLMQMQMQSTSGAVEPSSQFLTLQDQHRDLHLLPSTFFVSSSLPPPPSSISFSPTSILNTNSNMTSAMKIPAAATTIAPPPSVHGEVRLIHIPPSSTPSASSVESTKQKQDDTTTASRTKATATVRTPTVAASTKLGERLFGDVLVATAVTAGVAPFLTVVDKAIVESSAGTKTLLRSGMDSIRSMVQNPVSYVKSPTFLLMWSVYAATYATANSFKTLEEHVKYNHERLRQQQQQERNETTTACSSRSGNSDGIGPMGQIGIFIGTTIVNSGASMMKDRAYAQMFGSGGKGSGSGSVSFPKSSYAFWALRDLSVIGSSFILPDLVATKLSTDYGMDKSSTLSYCQLTLPVLTQVVAGPFHFLGLDVYNRNLSHLPNRTMVVKDRLVKLSQSFGPVVFARMARIAPGYGIGGVYNTKFRTAWRDFVVERHVESMMADNKNSKNSQAKSTGLVALLYGTIVSSKGR